MMTYIWLYLVLVNLLTAAVYIWDKHQAVAHRWHRWRPGCSPGHADLASQNPQMAFCAGSPSYLDPSGPTSHFPCI